MKPAIFLLAGVALLNPSARAADVFKGKDLYQTYCLNCHGASGQGELPGMPNFARGQGLMQADLALFETISAGRSAMPAFRGVLDEQEILDVIAYIRTLY